MPALLAETGVDPADVIGIGIDFTSCTMLPTTADGTPLCLLPDLRRDPHAWVKLWKHHAAQPEADLINAVAARARRAVARALRRQDLLRVVLREVAADPARGAGGLRPRRPADRGGRLGRLAADRASRRGTAARPATRRCGRSADGFPPDDYFAALDPRFEHVDRREDVARHRAARDRAGGLSEQAAAWTGLPPGRRSRSRTSTRTSRRRRPTVTEPGPMVAIMGTSICHILLGREPAVVEGMCGVVEDGVVPGLFGFEAGQSAVGDIFAWFVETCVPPEVHDEAPAAGHARPRLARGARRRELEPGRERAARARLVERQPVGARRRRARRPARRDDARRRARPRSTGR